MSGLSKSKKFLNVLQNQKRSVILIIDVFNIYIVKYRVNTTKQQSKNTIIDINYNENKKLQYKTLRKMNSKDIIILNKS